MKGFFKSVLATIVALFIVGIITFVLSLGIFGLILSSSSETYVLKDNTVFELKLEGTLKDRAPAKNPLYEYLGVSQASNIGLDDILSGIQKAKENEKIKGIYIHAGMLFGSTASLQEIRNALTDFKKSGKFVVAYGDTYSQGCYYLASVADKIVLNPQGMVDLHGLSASPMFYKGLLDKLGIEMQIFKVGTYKSAVEPYINEKMSDANREQVASFLNDTWGSVLADISASRKISVENLNSLADTCLMMKDPKYLATNKVIDTLLYETEMKDYLKSLVKVDKDDDLSLASVSNLITVPLKEENTAEDKIAVLYAEGGIYSGQKPDPNGEDILDGPLIKEIEKLRKDDKVKAVVFRVNSPGGSAYASEQIWKAITDLKAKKPVVVSMGDYAASGGYYISCNASKIIAQPTTLTGSIGIFGLFPNAEGLTKKIGLSFDNVKTNQRSDFGEITRPMRADEKAMLQRYINNGYDLFLTRCADGRKMEKDSLAKIAEGRVWTGKQALAIGLVDGLGGMDVAIKEAAKLAKLKDYSLQNYPKKTSFFDLLLSSSKDDMAAKAMKEYLGADYKAIKSIKELQSTDYVQARLPYDIQMK